MRPEPYRILIVNKHRILRQGLRTWLERAIDFHVVGDGDGTIALAQARELQPDIILLDVQLPEVEDGLKLLSEIRKHAPDSRVIVLTPSEAASTLVYRAMRTGAFGYVPENTSDIHVVEAAIRKVGEGNLFLSDDALASLIAALRQDQEIGIGKAAAEPEGLSHREFEVLDLVAEGNTNRQISARLVIAESTVRTHLHSILGKLRLLNRVQIATYALRTRPNDRSRHRAAQPPNVATVRRAKGSSDAMVGPRSGREPASD